MLSSVVDSLGPVEIVGSTEFIASVGGALFGALAAFVFSHLMERRKSKQERVKLVFDFHKEFSTPEFGSHRRTGKAFITTPEFKKMPRNVDRLIDENSPEIGCLLTIARFFQRLSVACQYKLVDGRILVHVFPESFYYWYYNYFNENLTGQWSALQSDLKFLADFFEKNLRQKHILLVTKVQNQYRN